MMISLKICRKDDSDDSRSQFSFDRILLFLRTKKCEEFQVRKRHGLELVLLNFP